MISQCFSAMKHQGSRSILDWWHTLVHGGEAVRELYQQEDGHQGWLSRDGHWRRRGGRDRKNRRCGKRWQVCRCHRFRQWFRLMTLIEATWRVQPLGCACRKVFATILHRPMTLSSTVLSCFYVCGNSALSSFVFADSNCLICLTWYLKMTANTAIDLCY